MYVHLSLDLFVHPYYILLVNSTIRKKEDRNVANVVIFTNI